MGRQSLAVLRLHISVALATKDHRPAPLCPLRTASSANPCLHAFALARGANDAVLQALVGLR